MNKIIKMNLNLENCDQIKLTIEDIRYLYIGDISQSITIGWYGDQDESFSCNHFEISIKKSKNTMREDFDMKGAGDPYKLFERFINGKDIVSVEIIYDDGVSKTFGVLWDDEDEYSNNYMTTEISKENDLIIKIKKND